jgi:uncharacterized protein (DUF58 family)
MRQRDSVGLAVVDEVVRTEIKAGLRPATLKRITTTLAESKIAGQSDVPQCLNTLQPSSRSKGMMILLTDAFGDPEELRRSLSNWSAAGHDCFLIEILAPEELEFSFRGPVVFDDLEASSSQIEIDAGQIRRVYLERLGNHRDQVARAATRSRTDHLEVRTDHELAEVLRQFLIRRTAVNRARAGRGRR